MKSDIYEHISDEDLNAQMKRIQDELDRRKDEAERLKAASLEAKFREAVNAATQEIKAILDEYKLIKDRAALVSEKYGIPFKMEEGEQKWTYTPHTYDKMWAHLDENIRWGILDCTPDDLGWRHSYIC